MRLSVKALIVVLVTVMCLAAGPAVQAEDSLPMDLDGYVTQVYPDLSTIWIGDLPIIGFPFNSLEDQLSEAMGKEITISVGDWVSIVYYEKDLPDPYKLDVNKFISLTDYCVQDTDDCYSSSGEEPPPLEPGHRENRTNKPDEPEQSGNGPEYQHRLKEKNPN